MPDVQDDTVNERNMALLKQESAKPSLMVTIEQLCLEQVTNKMMWRSGFNLVPYVIHFVSVINHLLKG